ncbi:MAG: hypothetical protein JWO11_277 [Nocardioides sp.]|nr:hypothetical protein [Nocardioides sp.]
MRHALAAGCLLVIGAAVGLATVALHELSWGLPLAAAAVGLTMFALPAGWWTRLPFAIGLVGLVGWLTIPRPEGDYAIGSDVPGYVLISLGVAVIVAAVTTLPRPVRQSTEESPPLA